MKDIIIKIKDCAVKNETGGRCAALAYYLLFSVFPVIGVLNIILKTKYEYIEEMIVLLPEFIGDILEMYIDYISAFPEITLLSTILFAFLYMPFRAVKYILWDMRKVYGLKNDIHFVKRNILVLFYTVMLLVVLVFSLAVTIVSGDLLTYLLGSNLGRYIKYLTPCVAMFIFLVFIFKTGTKKAVKDVYIGAILSSVMWHLGSIVFSLYVNTFDKYTVVYGSLGSFMAFLVWLYFTCFCVLMGIRLNFVLVNE